VSAAISSVSGLRRRFYRRSLRGEVGPAAGRALVGAAVVSVVRVNVIDSQSPVLPGVAAVICPVSRNPLNNSLD
jgi:hypothetical protein